jgi:hypothetical protein
LIGSSAIDTRLAIYTDILPVDNFDIAVGGESLAPRTTDRSGLLQESPRLLVALNAIKAT